MRVSAIIFFLMALIASPLATLRGGPIATVVWAGDYSDDERGETEMLREQQRQRDRDEFDAMGDRSEREQEHEMGINVRREERNEEKEEGDGGIKEFFNEK